MENLTEGGGVDREKEREIFELEILNGGGGFDVSGVVNGTTESVGHIIRQSLLSDSNNENYFFYPLVGAKKVSN